LNHLQVPKDLQKLKSSPHALHKKENYTLQPIVTRHDINTKITPKTIWNPTPQNTPRFFQRSMPAEKPKGITASPNTQVLLPQRKIGRQTTQKRFPVRAKPKQITIHKNDTKAKLKTTTTRAPIDINIFHQQLGHINERLLRDTDKHNKLNLYRTL
jgi:hypothetical protein